MIENYRQAFAGQFTLPRAFWNYYQIPLLVVSILSMWFALRYTHSDGFLYLILTILGYTTCAFFAYVMAFGVFRSLRDRPKPDFWGILAAISVVLNMIWLPLVIIGVVMGLSNVRTLKQKREATRQELLQRLEDDDAHQLRKNALDTQLLYYGDRIVHVRQIDPAFTREIDWDQVRESERQGVCRTFADDFEDGSMISVGYRYEFTNNVVEFTFKAEDCPLDRG